VNKSDYDRLKPSHRLTFLDVDQIQPGKNLRVSAKNEEGEFVFEVAHTLNDLQIGWFKAGSALNFMATKTNPTTK